jgi:hypothetical protein
VRWQLALCASAPHPFTLPSPPKRAEREIFSAIAGTAYFAATGMFSAYISGSTVSRHVISRGKIFSIARAE